MEVNALFSRQGVQSVNAGPLPANILPLVARHVYNQENTLTAALTCDRTLGLTTFMNDPQVTLNWNQAKNCLTPCCTIPAHTCRKNGTRDVVRSFAAGRSHSAEKLGISD